MKINTFFLSEKLMWLGKGLFQVWALKLRIHYFLLRPFVSKGMVGHGIWRSIKIVFLLSLLKRLLKVEFKCNKTVIILFTMNLGMNWVWILEWVNLTRVLFLGINGKTWAATWSIRVHCANTQKYVYILRARLKK